LNISAKNRKTGRSLGYEALAKTTPSAISFFFFSILGNENLKALQISSAWSAEFASFSKALSKLFFRNFLLL